MIKHLALTTAMLVAPIAAHATQPQAGTYLTTLYASQASGECPFGYGETIPGAIFVYPGPSRTGAALKVVGSGATSIDLITLPATPAAGAATWKGNFSDKIAPGNETITGKFQFTFRYIGAEVFGGTLTLSGDCNATLDMMLVWIASAR